MKKLLVILAMTLLGATNVFSQEQTKTLYDVYLEMGNDAYENGNYESAINWITKASEYAKNKCIVLALIIVGLITRKTTTLYPQLASIHQPILV